MALDISNAWIEVPCPGCDFANQVRVSQIILGERIICCGCHCTIQLVDADTSTHLARRAMREASRRLEKTTIKTKLSL